MRRRQRVAVWVAALLFLVMALSGTIPVALASTKALLADSEGDTITRVDDLATYAEETATFALGCFWGAEAMFGALPGVVRTTVGYAGGTRGNPTYYDIGDHAEAVQVVFRPQVTSYDELLVAFWLGHDPCRASLNSQYRSLILAHGDAQRQRAEAFIEAQAEAAGCEPATEILSYTDFTRAEDYHQKFRVQSEPVLAELLLAQFETFDAFIDSTLAARVNGVLGREAAIDQAAGELTALGLSDEGLQFVRRAIGASCEPVQAESFDPAWRAEEDDQAANCPLPGS